MTSDAGVVSGKPSKSFFVEMITRDLGITDCILDLIDNSIDHAVTTTDVNVMSVLSNGARPRLQRFYVSLKLSTAGFVIEDNCGGISIEDARTRVFRFGDSEGRKTAAGLSVYGIGMKRAFFKLGNVIRVRSATTADAFIVDINVNRWKEQGDDDWDFRFAEYGPLARRHDRYPPRTTRITISKLHKEVGGRFDEPTFLKALREKIAWTYGLFLSAGLDISVNGTRVSPDLPTIGGYSEKLRPARYGFKTGPVDVLIIAGVTPRDDKRAHGWYVFCNGRMILQADKSRTTGWGDNLPQWHSKYQHFAGYVYFHSNEVRALPWTTTKQNVVAESPVYQAALAQMQIQSRPILSFFNKLYPVDIPEEDVAEREILSKARNITLSDLPKKDSVFRVAPPAPRAPGSDTVRIQYSKPRKFLERIKQHLGRSRMSAGAIGSHTFDYYIKQELD